MSRRSRAREIALQVLYQCDLNPEQPQEVEQRFLEARLNHNRQLIQFAKDLLVGVRKHQQTIDPLLQSTAQNWALHRMPATDRNILRIGAFEILYTDTPDRVAINEAIEMAKRYGTQNSAQFVNGLLDRLMHARPADVIKPVPQFRRNNRNSDRKKT
jgi:transcription antitermination protein NusB